MQAVANVGPAAVVVHRALAAAVPGKGGRRIRESSKLRVRGNGTVGLSRQHFPIDGSITSTVDHNVALANHQDQAVELHIAADGERPGYNQHARSTAEVDVAVDKGDLWVGSRAVGSATPPPSYAATVAIVG